MQFFRDRRFAPAARGIVALGCALGLRPAAAVEYRLDGDFTLGQSYNSNIVLTDPALDAFGTRLDANARLSVRERNWEAGGNARIDRHFYYPASGIDMTNLFVDGRSAYFTERSRWSLAGGYTDAWTLSSMGQPADVTGLILTRLHRDQYSVEPSCTYALDETTTATLGYGYNHARYDFADGGRSRQDSQSVSTELVRQFDARWSGNLDLSYSHWGTTRGNPDYSTTSDYVSATLGLRYALDETLSLNAAAGAQYSRTETEFDQYRLKGYLLVGLDPVRYVPVVETVHRTIRQPSPIAPLFSVSARKRFETSELNLGYSRQISPSFNGLLLTTDRVTAGGTRRLLETLDGSVAVNYYTQSYSGNGNGADYSVYSLDGTLSWRLGPNWSASATYQYTRRDSDAVPSRDASAVYLNLKYDFDGLSF